MLRPLRLLVNHILYIDWQTPMGYWSETITFYPCNSECVFISNTCISSKFPTDILKFLSISKLSKEHAFSWCGLRSSFVSKFSSRGRRGSSVPLTFQVIKAFLSFKFFPTLYILRPLLTKPAFSFHIENMGKFCNVGKTQGISSCLMVLQPCIEQ